MFDVLEKAFAHDPEWLHQVGHSPSTPSEVVAPCLAVAVAVAAPREVILGDFRARATFDGRPQLPLLKMSGLVLAGADDLLTDQVDAGARQRPRGGAPHAGNFVHHEQPMVVHNAISTFLTEVP